MESPATGVQTDDQKSLAASIPRPSLKSSETNQAPLSKPVQWKCTYCDKLYHRKANLLKHRIITHSSELNGISHAFQVNGNARVNVKRKRDDKKRAKTIPCKRNDDVNWKMKPKPVGRNRKRSRCTYREIKPKLNTAESRSALTDSKASDALTQTNADESCPRLVDSTVSVAVPLDSNVVSDAANASGSYVFVDLQNKTDQSDATMQNTAKLYVLNGNVVKDENTNGGLICLANNLSDIENLGIPVLNPTMSNGECNVVAVPMSTFIPFNQNANTNVSSVTATSTNVSVKNGDGEILRSKLSESVPNAAVADTMTTMVAIPVTNAVAANKQPVKTKRDEAESPALVKAKNDLIKWKKLLIETAIHPQIPQFKLPTDYTGPTYSCEECDDTFISLVGLENHKNRRSVLFTYACPICEQTLEFYNRCTFLIHVRLHDATVKACFLTISTIPASKLNFEVFDDDTNFIESSATDAKNDDAMQLPHDEAAAGNATEADRLQSSPPVPAVVTAEVATSVEPEGRKRKRETNELANSKTNRKRRTLRALGLASKEEMSAAGQENSAIMETINSVVAKQFASKTAGRPTPPKKAKSAVEEITLTSSDDDDDGGADDEASSRLNGGGAETNAADTPTKSMVKCRECHAEVPSLTSHYRAANRPLKEFHCEQCKFFNPSKCALEAHSRMHKRAQPYVCPDCGFYFSTMDSFSTHVKQVCFYDFKTIRFKCPQCSLLKPSAPQFDDHLKRHHIGKVYKCSECNASAYLEKNIVEHIKKNVHADRPASVVEGFRCLLCPSMLVTKQSINMHVKKHVFGLEYLRYVYICKCCKKFATGQMAKFAKHYDQCVDRDDWRASSEKATKARKMKASSSEGEETNADVDAAEAARLKNAVSRAKSVCAMCRVSKLNDAKSLFCKACVNSVNGENAGAADSAKNENTYRSKRRFKCKLCKKLMNRDMTTITKHYEREHRVDGDVNAKKMIDSGSLDRDVSRRRRSSVKSQSKNNGSPVEPKTEAPDPVSPTTLSEQYREVSSLPKAVAMSAFSLMSKSAALAASQTKSSEADRKRRSSRYKMTSHDRKENTRTRSVEAEQADGKKSRTSNYECMECGLSFIVKPSLEKHLIIEHKIYDVKEYYRVNNYLDDDEESDEKKKVAVNQCEVCYLQCNSKQNYDKHIRTHGMAFVTMQSRAKS